jgi:hypothetical protein
MSAPLRLDPSAPRVGERSERSSFAGEDGSSGAEIRREGDARQAAAPPEAPHRLLTPERNYGVD